MKLEDVKRNWFKPVLYDGTTYEILDCVMWLDRSDMKFKYSLTLLDRNGNSTVRAPIVTVELKKEG